MGLLDGCRALVTGGGSGIGAATCRRMAAEGASVAVVDIDGDAAKEVADEIDGVAFAVDVTDYAALEAACRDAAHQLGGLTILFNNAGNSNMAGIHEWDLAEWDRVVRLNLTGVFHGMRAAIPLMLDTERGAGRAIVTTSSISGTRPAAGEAPYAAAKAAVAALTATAALEYAPDIRVNAVAPGNDPHGPDRHPAHRVRLDRPAHGSQDTRRRASAHPKTSPTSSCSCAPTAARFMTGQNLVVDGGMTLHGSGVDGLLDRFREMLNS